MQAGLSTVVSLATALLAPSLASAACPGEFPAECLGAASNFNLVTTDSARLGVQRLTEDGFSFLAYTTVSGNACTETASAVSPPTDTGGPTSVEQLAVMATNGVGVKAKTVGSVGPGSIGLQAYTIATAGATVGSFVEADDVDTSGTHPLIADCADARQAMIAAAADLAAAPATGNLGSVVLAPDEVRTITLGPGVNIVDADQVSIGKGASLSFGGDSTYWAVIRTNVFRTKSFGDIDDSGIPILFLLTGTGPSVKISTFSDLFGVGVLAPERTVRLAGEAHMEALWAKKALLLGVDLFGSSFQF